MPYARYGETPEGVLAAIERLRPAISRARLAREPRPQHPVPGRQTQTLPARSIDDRQLVAEGEDFQV